jgi:Galactose oxidase, central domain/Kelch motif
MKRTRNIAQHPFGLILALVGLISVATFALEPVALARVDPSWIPTGSMNTPRVNHTATLLLNGKVLVAGGYNAGTILNSAELYDPATGTWSVTGSLNTARFWHTATLRPDGRVLVTGGGRNLNTAELYDPNTGTWSITASLNTGRYRHTATPLPDGKVLVTGGFTGSSTSGRCPCIDFVTNSAELYDPATGHWSVTGNLKAERGLHTATLLQNGKVLVAGGTDGTLIDIGEYVPYSSAELYDPATGTWSLTGGLNTARNSHTATLLPSGKVLAAAGYYTDTAELYDPSTGMWSFTASLSTPGGHTATLLSNSKVLVVQGSREELYDPATAVWSVTANLSTARSDHTATRLLDGRVLVAGGDTYSAILNSAELYDSPSQLVAAVLPSSRSVQVGTPATAFATIINTDSNTATGCAISPITTIPATFTYQTTSSATNQITNSPNTPVDIPAVAAQSFVFALTPTAPFAPADVQLSFNCANSDPAPIISGLNTFLFSASSGPIPDMLAMAATLTGDGIVSIPGTNGTGVFAVATVNLGASGNLTVSADTGGAILPVNIFICQTDPQTSACFLSPESSVNTMIGSNETPTFGVFVAAAGDISFAPETNRIFVRFKDSGNVTRGSTSVAVRTQ